MVYCHDDNGPTISKLPVDSDCQGKEFVLKELNELKKSIKSFSQEVAGGDARVEDFKETMEIVQSNVEKLTAEVENVKKKQKDPRMDELGNNK